MDFLSHPDLLLGAFLGQNPDKCSLACSLPSSAAKMLHLCIMLVPYFT